MNFKISLAAASIATLTAFGASASVITAPVAAYVPFAQLEAFTAGPVTVAPGITWTSTNVSTQGGSVYGYTYGYGFGSNGYDTENMVGLNDSSDYYGIIDSMTFSFANPVSSVGAYINWVPSYAPVTIAVYDASNNLLESLTVSQGGVNLVAPKGFYGFLEGSANISKFVLTDGYIGALSGLNGSAISGGVPEPATWALMLVGFGGLGLSLRARRRAAVTAA